MVEKKVQKRTIESREKINAAAWKLFCEKGYFNTNTKEIAQTAGISVGNFYNYYQDKFDVYYELAAQYLHGSASAIIDLEEVLLQAGDRRLVLEHYINTQMNRAMATGRFFSDCQVLVQDRENLGRLFAEDTKSVIQSIELLLRKIPDVKQRASYPVMARILFTLVDKLSEDACTQTDPVIYEEYRRQLTELVQEYLFGATVRP